MDTLQLARKEAEAWKLAQVGEAMEEPETIGPAQKTGEPCDSNKTHNMSSRYVMV